MKMPLNVRLLKSSALVDLLDGGSSAATGAGGVSAAGSATHAAHVWHTAGAASALVQLGDDRVANTLHLLLLVLELLDLSQLVGVQPLDGLVALVIDGLAVVVADLVLDLLVVDGGLHVEAVGLEAVLGRDALLLLLVLGLELLGVVNHALNLLLGEAALKAREKG